MTPYVPAKNMVLSSNVRTFVEGDEGVIHYLSPYAHSQHEGYVMVSCRITGSPWAKKGESKVVTDRFLNHSGGRDTHLQQQSGKREMKAAKMEAYTAAVTGIHKE